MYEVSGTIKVIEATQTFPSGFSKREFVVTTEHDKYPQDLKFSLMKDKCSALDQFELGQQVKVSFDIRGSEYKGRYYVDLNCWRLESGTSDSTGRSAATKSNSRASVAKNDSPFPDDEPGETIDEPWDDDSIPF